MVLTEENRTERSLEGYHAVREDGVGVIDLSSRGRIHVGGSEAVMFLNGLITNDMKTLSEHHWMPAAFPNVQGRLIAAVRVIRLSDDTNGAKTSPRFLIDTEAATHDAVMKTIGRFTMAGDFRVADVTATTKMFSVQGRGAEAAVRALLGHSVELARDGVMEMRWHDTDVTVIRASHTSEDGFDIVVDSTQGADMAAALAEAGGVGVSSNAAETLRIESGIGRFGLDMDETNVISETNLDDSVSFTKGCYIGQEIIARIKYRGHVAKKLTGLIFETDSQPSVGAVVKSTDGKEIGRITSTTLSPKLNHAIALAYLRYEHLTPGTEAFVDSELKARVAELPFVRGSWYESNT
jgi:folate-binding protein YgfZ